MTLTRAMLEDGGMLRMIAEASPTLQMLTDAERAASLRATLDARPEGRDGVWLFAYGSLIWNPALECGRRRAAHIHGWHRAFCLSTVAGRGTPDAPGLVLGLDRGGACGGAAFWIEEAVLERELALLWQREMLSGSYQPRWVGVRGPTGCRSGRRSRSRSGGMGRIIPGWSMRSWCIGCRRRGGARKFGGVSAADAGWTAESGDTGQACGGVVGGGRGAVWTGGAGVATLSGMSSTLAQKLLDAPPVTFHLEKQAAKPLQAPMRVSSRYEPAGDQPAAIRELLAGVRADDRDQVLLGVTGSGKTFTMAKVIEASQRPTLILAPNKTLAAQLYAEMKGFFPDNAVEYFVSYYDYYQPEAYVPRTDTYIEKDSQTNEAIDRMRHSATRALLERGDVVIVASVSCIYGIGSVETYGRMVVKLEAGGQIDRIHWRGRWWSCNIAGTTWLSSGGVSGLGGRRSTCSRAISMTGPGG